MELEPSMLYCGHRTVHDHLLFLGIVGLRCLARACFDFDVGVVAIDSGAVPDKGEQWVGDDVFPGHKAGVWVVFDFNVHPQVYKLVNAQARNRGEPE